MCCLTSHSSACSKLLDLKDTRSMWLFYSEKLQFQVASRALAVGSWKDFFRRRFRGLSLRVEIYSGQGGAGGGFCRVRGWLPWELIEVKYKEETVSRSLIYTERLKPKRAYQLVAGLDKPYDRGNIRILSPLQYVVERSFG